MLQGYQEVRALLDDSAHIPLERLRRVLEDAPADVDSLLIAKCVETLAKVADGRLAAQVRASR